MITDPKTAAWLDLLDPGDPAPLEALRAEAEQAEATACKPIRCWA